jgi:putative ABC transport system permease protein
VTTKIVLENINHKPMRTLLSVLLIAVPVTLILSLVGSSEGFSRESQNRVRGIGADAVMRGTTATAVTTSSGASIKDEYTRFLEEQPHVKLAMGIVVHSVEFPFLSMTGVDLKQFDQMSGGFEYIAGRPLRDPDDVLLDEPYANQQNKKVGETIRLANHDWHIVGIIKPGKLARIVVKKETLQYLDSATGMDSIIYIKLDDPSRAEEFVRRMRQVLPKFGFETMEYYTSLFAVSNVKSLVVFTYVVIGIGVVIGFAVVCLSMYMAVLQRTREIGILKSLGGSKSFILRIILVESALLGIGGTILGIGLSYVAAWAIRSFVPASFPMVIVYSWWPKAAVMTLIGTELGALYPGFNAASNDPIEALAYE